MEVLQYPVALWNELDRIEQQFDEKSSLRWMHDYWWLSFVFSVTYLLLIFVGTRAMKDREPFDLRKGLCMWSTGLSVFSAYACIKIFPMLWNLGRFGGFAYTVCDTSFYIGSTGMGVWAFLFPFSKLPELIDTAFIVLRKSKLSFLHYYHHFSVFIYCWYSYAFPISTGVWFGTINFFVHSIMYAYYAVKASGRNPPRIIAKAITTLQLSQMFFGIFLNYSAFKAFLDGKVCAMDWFTIGISIFFYATYAILFGNFYYWTYVYKKSRTKAKTIDVSSSNDKNLQNGHLKNSKNNSSCINGLSLANPTQTL